MTSGGNKDAQTTHEDAWYVHRRRGTTYEGQKQVEGGDNSTSNDQMEEAAEGRSACLEEDNDMSAEPLLVSEKSRKGRRVSVTSRNASRSATDGAALADSAAASADAKEATRATGS
jgi:hypothetical protein